MTAQDVAVIGCGHMGSAIAQALQAAGTGIVAFNRSSGPLAPLVRMGMNCTTDITAAVGQSKMLIFVLSDYAAFRSVVDSVTPGLLAGKAVVNLSSGSAANARDANVLMTRLGASYLDGSIWALPSMIGAPDTVITCSGSPVAWTLAEPVIRSIGGASFHTGAAVDHANVLEACFPGSFYMAAQSCFIEAIRIARAAGISDETVTRSIAPSLSLLGIGLRELVSRFANRDYETAEATLDVYDAAARAYKETATSLSSPSGHLDLVLGEFEAAIGAGKGRLAPAAILDDGDAKRPLLGFSD